MNNTDIAAHMELVDATEPFVKLFQQADANRDQPMDGRSNIEAQIAVKDLRRLVYAADDARNAVEASARKLAAPERTEQAAMVTIPAREGFAAPEADALYFDAAMPPVVVKWLSEHPPTNMAPIKPQQAAPGFVMVPNGWRDAVWMAHEHMKLRAYYCHGHNVYDALESLLTASPTAQPSVEPVAWTLTETLEKRQTTTTGYRWFTDPINSSWTPLYTTPPPAPVLLSDAEIEQMWNMAQGEFLTLSSRARAFARAIEQAIGRASREAK